MPDPNLINSDRPAGYEPFRKATFSGGNDGCVEVAYKSDRTDVLVQDTKNRGPVVPVGALAWTAFIGAVKGDQIKA